MSLFLMKSGAIQAKILQICALKAHEENKKDFKKYVIFD